jgi:hypothetical protein
MKGESVVAAIAMFACLALLMFGLQYMLSVTDNEQEKTCADDCHEFGYEYYKSSSGSAYAGDSCSCLKDGEPYKIY